MSGNHSAESVFAAMACKSGKTLRKNMGRGRKRKGAGNVVTRNFAEMIVDRAQQTASKHEKPAESKGSDDDEVMKLSKKIIELHQKSKELAQNNRMLIEQLSALLKAISHDVK